jgi:hypothetical protein
MNLVRVLRTTWPLLAILAVSALTSPATRGATVISFVRVPTNNARALLPGTQLVPVPDPVPLVGADSLIVRDLTYDILVNEDQPAQTVQTQWSLTRTLTTTATGEETSLFLRGHTQIDVIDQPGDGEDQSVTFSVFGRLGDGPELRFTYPAFVPLGDFSQAVAWELALPIAPTAGSALSLTLGSRVDWLGAPESARLRVGSEYIVGVNRVPGGFNPVPEPGTLVLAGLGVAGLGLARIRRRSVQA